jgi:diacylglycerol kinase (ATP)
MPMSQKLSSLPKPNFETVLPSDAQSSSGQNEASSPRRSTPPESLSSTERTALPTDTLQEHERTLSWKVASNIFVSFKYAWDGVSYAFISQRNFRIHVSVCALAIGLSVFLQLKAVEIAVIGITSGLVMALELVNTAIESIVDLTVKQTYHELAKIAKDCAAAAVLVSALVAVLVAGMLLLPPLLKLIMLAI